MIIAIDSAVIAIVLFCIWRGYKNVLIRGVFGTVTLIAALFIASITATAYSGEFTGMLKPFVGGVIEKTLTDIRDEGENSDTDSRENESQKFGLAFTVLRRIGLPESSAANLSELVSKDDESDGTLADIITDKLCNALAFIAVFGIGFLLISIIFTVIGNLIGFVFSLPGLKLIDSIAGVVFGFIKGLIIVFTLATVIRYVGLLAQETLEETKILSYIVNYNMIANMLGV